MEKLGGAEQAEKKIFNSYGRMEKWDKELWGEDTITGKEIPARG